MSKIIEIVNNPLLLDVKAGITAAKNEAVDITKFLVNDVAIPVISVILAGVLLLALVKCVKKHRDGDDYSKNIVACVVIVVVIALVLSARTWLWVVVGQ